MNKRYIIRHIGWKEYRVEEYHDNEFFTDFGDFTDIRDAREFIKTRELDESN